MRILTFSTIVQQFTFYPNLFKPMTYIEGIWIDKKQVSQLISMNSKERSFPHSKKSHYLQS